MGLVGDWLKGRRMKDPVHGTLQVTACTRAPDHALSGNFMLSGVVTGDGVFSTAVEHSGVAKVRKWPHPGRVLPVTVDRADPTRLRIEWSEVEGTWEMGRRVSDQIADAERQAQGAGHSAAPASTSGNAFTHTTTHSTMIDASSVPGLRDEIMRIAQATASNPELMQQLVQARLVETGVLNADGTPGPAATVKGASSSLGAAGTEQGGPAERLRALEKLRQDGLVSEAEYQRLRTQILTDL